MRANIDGTRFPCFDGLRALAALSVLGVHTAFFSGVTGRSGLGIYTARLEIGVAVFFVISGFLLYRPFVLSHVRDETAPRLGPFWLRRLKRIVPAYWLAFLVISYLLHADTIRHGWGSLAIYLGFAQIYFPSHIVTGILQAWSLCTEMSFYLALPFWALLMRWAGRRYATGRVQERRHSYLRAELAGLAGLVGFSFVFRVIVWQSPGALARTMSTWLPANVDLFALGMLLAVLSSWWTATDRPALLWHPALPWVSWVLAAGVYVVVSNIGLPTQPLGDFSVGAALTRQTLYGLFAFLLVAPAVMGDQNHGLIRNALQWRPVALLGVVSYGIYLWHESLITLILRWTGDPLFGIGFFQLTLAATVLANAVATASYVMLERPILHIGRNRVATPSDRRAIRRSAAALVAVEP